MRTSESAPLEVMTFPLHGARIIEASAGTGKTFAIVGLYLRLLLGHGNFRTRHQEVLRVDQILVVTFTEAAIAELKNRIRLKIRDVRVAFLRNQTSDPFIKRILEDLSDHKQVIAILLNAERQIDEAAIYTIHGFCQRMLFQNAFESGSPFNSEFVPNESHLKLQVVTDYWRRNFYPLSLSLASEVRKLWASPLDLLYEIDSYLSDPQSAWSIKMINENLIDLHQKNLKRIDELKTLWMKYKDHLLDLILNSDVNKHSYTEKSLKLWFNTISAWSAMENTGYNFPDKLEKFAQNVLIKKTAIGSNAPTHFVFDIIASFFTDPISLKIPLITHAVAHCRASLIRVKKQKQCLSFNDLLVQLSESIDMDDQSLLAERIRTLYPVVMIDEFQDIDPLQYSIFSRIYLDYSECGLFMIGDPKQAIYGFRGADIFTYIKARNEAIARYTLNTNWRSSADMVRAVNQIFSKPTSPFIYDDDIPFLEVDYSSNANQRYWLLNGDKQPSITYWLHSENQRLLSKSEYLNVMSKATASQIQTILTVAKKDNSYFVSGDKKMQIQAADIAVLVRTISEGHLVKRTLAKQGIASVFSNAVSVFSSMVALDVKRLIEAVLLPEDNMVLKSSLASDLFALNIADLDAFNKDEILWDKIVNEFRNYRTILMQRGVFSMIRSVMSKRCIAECLLKKDDGERMLTDLMHIGELLQQASHNLDSNHSLLRWLTKKISCAQNGLDCAEEHTQRLESERNLVRIVTIHKSKGLEYNLVFLPFVFSYRKVNKNTYYHEKSERRIFSCTHNVLKQAEKERLAEDLRLIYVALTRAVYGCFIGAAPIRNGYSAKEPTGVHNSAIGYLLQNGKEGNIEDLLNSIQFHVNRNLAVVISDVPTVSDEIFIDVSKPIELFRAKELKKHIDRLWGITSYSGLIKQSLYHSRHDSILRLTDFSLDERSDKINATQSERSIFTFPRGVSSGVFLHSLFEEIEFTLPTNSKENIFAIKELMRRSQLEIEWLPVLQKLLYTVLNTPLDGEELILNQKRPQERLAEMEFLLPIEILTSSALNRVIQYYDPISAKAEDLGFESVQGMLKGFIDLVFKHCGKYYVLDWKSNYLGEDVSYYNKEALEDAMINYRYDFQYQIYALALHRFLRSRISDYSYEKHFGGIYYLFLRGMDGQSNHGIFSTKPELGFLEDMEKLINGKPVTYVR
ncbi:exodeoxyribonuclease V beta chain [Candidatus Photodesmus blepharus]|uniref:RecBCD enzyme subunit RecB n=1 Tax=Candidatus Photodesmus blepharonis TaxID=1179155 RepID=A0A084CP30_9GAMM|nr:exodeoxyribonuclease V subunit beta [Candidatus Photodesmus blepharus]KEY91559.1 exodeoxyribonuclease V beta chain [Candidatus Photodesmus blepharus]